MRILVTTLAALALASGAAPAQEPGGGGGQQLEAPPPAGATEGTPTAEPAPPSTPSQDVPGGPREMMGKEVVGTDGERIGRVSDVILGPDGQAATVVVATGEKEIGIDFAQVRIPTDQVALQAAGLARADLATMPEFRMEEGMTSLARGRR
jgi:hypothetical protein